MQPVWFLAGKVYVERGFVAWKGSSKHILKQHKCHVDSPITASILLPRRRRYTLGTRGVYGTLGVDTCAGVTKLYRVTHRAILYDLKLGIIRGIISEHAVAMGTVKNAFQLVAQRRSLSWLSHCKCEKSCTMTRKKNSSDLSSRGAAPRPNPVSFSFESS